MKQECYLRPNLPLEFTHMPLQNTPNEKLGVRNRKHNSCLSSTHAELTFRRDRKIAKNDY
jgi:hypothetical protein